ncbi:hypothetical protein ABZX98_07350 [Streptomyces sp. NPDC002992]|uniref:hypothetical protein n=1 Tax=Streptomyces sp. NPDC002992 TaxID=3154273 RepID=UPI00339EC619
MSDPARELRFHERGHTGCGGYAAGNAEAVAATENYFESHWLSAMTCGYARKFSELEVA